MNQKLKNYLIDKLYSYDNLIKNDEMTNDEMSMSTLTTSWNTGI